jgi:hypothetical protein
MYYVYCYIDPRNNKPFYIGKGTGDRKYRHLSESEDTTSNKHKYSKIKAIKSAGLHPIIIELASFTTDVEAYDYELEQIKKYGRKGYDHNGILTNITLGVNPPCRKGVKLSEEAKEKLKGRIPWNKGKLNLQPAWNKGLTKETDERVLKYATSQIGKKSKTKRVLSDETKEKLRLANLGKKKSVEARQKMSNSKKGKEPWNYGIKTGIATRSIPTIFISPEGVEMIYTSCKAGCIEHNLSTSKMCEVRKGRLTHYKGWTIK